MIEEDLPDSTYEEENYEIRQLVKSVKRSYLPIVYSGKSHRVALNEYHRLVSKHPHEYFELVKVVAVRKEVCLTFTSSIAKREESP